MLLTMTIIDPKQFTPKNKLVLCTGIFVKFYNWKSYQQVYEIYRIIKFEKMYISIIKNYCNLGTHWIIEISLILYNIYIISRN